LRRYEGWIMRALAAVAGILVLSPRRDASFSS
jgi:hypothetical protein